MSITNAEEPRRGATRSRPPRATRAAVAAPAFERANEDHEGAAAQGALSAFGALAGNLASQDWLIIAFFAIELVALSVAPHGPERTACIAKTSIDLSVFFVVLALIRVPILRWGGVASSLLYRVAIVGVVLGSYFQLRDILPIVSPWADDAQIYAFDMRVFGGEPAIWLDRYVTPSTTEWFAFFYFLYFLILAAHVVPMLFLSDNGPVIGRFAVGLLLVFLTAHLLYMAVPGWGPYRYLSSEFHHPLQGGTFWRLDREAVEAGGAQKDIFPSLHTAGPTFVAIFSFRHRKLVPFKYTWPVMAFFATQIIIATMFLRWHYIVDVIAGFTLAATAAIAGHRIADWEGAKRARLGLQPAWTPLAYLGSKGARA
jgi:membrane-associated phospholipid phosphatase